MKSAIFLTIKEMDNTNETGIYHDFINELSKYYDKVLVVSPTQRRNRNKTHIKSFKNVNILRVKIPNITKTNVIEKGISTVLIESLYDKALKKFYSKEKFDTIFYSTPPITFPNLISKLKKRNNATTYLILKDIFPQNAIDLNMFKKTSPFYSFFRMKEKKTYKISDYIGVMSPKNKEFILKHNKFINQNKVHIFRNALYDTSKEIEINKEKLYTKYNLNPNKVTFIYGGNLGAPQGAENIKEIIKNFDNVEKGQLVIVGSGTKFAEIQNYGEKIDNVYIFNQLPKNDYDELLKVSDVGLIFLDKRFTIPNYPSRLSSYLMLSKPILSMTDPNTDIGLEIVNNQCGYWINDGNVDNFINKAIEISNNHELRTEMGNNSKLMFNNYFKIENNVKDMMNFIHRY
ncbi:glycosyltransferase family 4 protein [Staphylococcus haemolyticus]|uniref:glycosyltransferase family 4 protein n=3 Tax=Staphylococcus haemolyticus TaxID=1283 RepID=UPI001F388D88|nr:glycosyltransferase family 4 protein [Staphylococcus haemolyticus]MCE5050662.1 glycosyltransferase family 4 protein [Staphylococcus haemolyticus]